MSVYLNLTHRCVNLTTGALLGVLICMSANAQQPEIKISGATMGTRYQVTAHFPDKAPDAAALQEGIDRRLAEIDLHMSTYRGDSEVSRFNQAAADQWFPVSADTAAVVHRAQEISQWTDGAFDVTVGPLVRLWHFGPAATDGFRPPSQAEISEALRRVGYKKLEVRVESPALRKTVSGLEVDLSAIAKGYAVDEVVQQVLEEGAGGCMVEIGGEVRVVGTRADGDSWTIGIESPTPGGRNLETVVSLKDAALASSGDYRNFFEYEGQVYSHTIDPREGQPVRHQLAAVSVTADDCMTADALATSLLVMGSEKGHQWAEENDVPALLLSRTGNGTSTQRTSNFVFEVEREAANYGRLFLITAIVFGVALAMMAVGVILGRSRIRGSCGGLAGLRDEKGNTLCEACTKPSPECRGEPQLEETK